MIKIEKTKDIIDQEYPNIPKYYFSGMSRSGLHAIVYWMAENFNEYIFFNDCQICHKQLIKDESKISIKSNKEPNVYIILFENKRPKKILKLIEDLNHKKFMLIMRDPYNLFASRMYGPEHCKTWFNLDINLWKQYAKICLENNDLFFNYNKWFIDENYRKYLCEFLELPQIITSSYKKINHLESSFDGMEYDKKADQMNVLKRYENCLNNKDYINLFDEEIKELALSLFDMEYPF